MNWAGLFILLGLIGLAVYTLPWGLVILGLLYLLWRTC